MLLRGSTAESRAKALTRNTMTPHTMTQNTNCTRGPFRLFLNSLVAPMPLLERTSCEGLVCRRWFLVLLLHLAFVAAAAGAIMIASPPSGEAPTCPSPLFTPWIVLCGCFVGNCPSSLHTRSCELCVRSRRDVFRSSPRCLRLFRGDGHVQLFRIRPVRKPLFNNPQIDQLFLVRRVKSTIAKTCNEPGGKMLCNAVTGHHHCCHHHPHGVVSNSDAL